MKRVIVVVVGLLAALAFASAAVSAPTGHDNGDGDHVTTTATYCIAGVTTNFTDPVSQLFFNISIQHHLSVYSYTEGLPYLNVSKQLILFPHLKWVDGTLVSVAAGACAGALPPPVANVFLCYSASQTDPGVWPVTEAAALIKAGYWSPYAVPNTVTGGTNIGGYHLVCNLATGQSAGTSVLGGAGEVYGTGATTDVTNVPGHYQVVGP